MFKVTEYAALSEETTTALSSSLWNNRLEQGHTKTRTNRKTKHNGSNNTQRMNMMTERGHRVG